MDDRFAVAGRRIVITGAASGIGLAMARGFASAGARLALVDRDRDAIEAVRHELAGAPHSPLWMTADIANRDAVFGVIATITQALGGIDAAFANAGIGAGPGFARPSGIREPAGALEAISQQLWDAVTAVDLSGAFWTLQALVQAMKAQGHGKIVFTTSIASFCNEAWVGTPYMPAKAGVAHLMRHAALELGAFGITVNAIAPGFFPTNIGKGKAIGTPGEIEQRIPLGRVGRDADVQGLAIFLASAASDFVTGVEIPLDGGMSLGRP